MDTLAVLDLDPGFAHRSRRGDAPRDCSLVRIYEDVAEHLRAGHADISVTGVVGHDGFGQMSLFPEAVRSASAWTNSLRRDEKRPRRPAVCFLARMAGRSGLRSDVRHAGIDQNHGSSTSYRRDFGIGPPA